MNIPAYPAFRPLELSDKPIFDAAFAAVRPENSEYTFTNLYAWRVSHGFGISLLGDMLILVSEQNGMRRFYPPIGIGDAAVAVKHILADTGSAFVRVPEGMADVIAADGAIARAEDRDNADYLFLTQDLIDLKGRKYDGKRNFIKNFKAGYRYEYIALTEPLVPDVLRFQDVWCVEKGCGQSKSLQDEAEAVKNMLVNLRLFGLIAGALVVDKAVCAVCIAEALNPETLVIHVLKAAQGMAGIYPALFNEFLSREARAYRYVNMEQDLGIPGLRASKESYHPVRLVKKFTLFLAGREVQ